MNRNLRWTTQRGYILALLVIIAGCGSDDEPRSQPSNRDAASRGSRRESAPADAGGRRDVRRKPFDVFADSAEPPLLDRTIDRPAPKSAAEAAAALKAIRLTYERASIPDVLKPPLTPESTRSFLVAMKFLTEQREKDAAWLEGIDAGEITDDTFEAVSLKNSVGGTILRLQKPLKKLLNETIVGSRRNFDSFLKNDVQLIRQGAAADANAEYVVKHVLTDPAQMQRRGAAVARIARLFQLAALFDEELSLEPSWPSVDDDGWPSQEELRDLVARYRRNLYAAATAVGPPEDVGNPELTRTAERVLTDSEYKLPKAERIIVTAGKRPFERTDYRVVDGAVWKDQYRGEKFETATIEKTEDCGYSIYFNDIQIHSGGPPDVPLNEWTLGRRFQGAPILKKNIESRQ